MIKPQHKHIIIRALCEKPPRDCDVAVEWWNELVDAIGMAKLDIDNNPICGYVDTPGNAGLTICGIIETSHIVLHIWDEQKPGLFQLDVYSCKPFDLNIVIKHLKDSYDVTKLQYKFLDRKTDLIMMEEN